MEEMHDNKLDKWGIFWSAVCAVHCMAIPIFAFVAPSLAAMLKHQLIHLIFFAIILPVAFFALWRPRRIHKSNVPVSLGGSGLLILLFSLYLDTSHDHHGHNEVHVLNIIGSILLIGAHMMNLKLHNKCCDHDHCHNHDH